MPGYRKRYRGRSRSYRKSRRGKYSRSRKASFRARVKKVIMKTAETKYKDIGVENVQLYHNLGATTLLAPGNVTAISQWFNPWATITPGNDRSERIGDKITPRGMSLKIYLASKSDRPNTMIRLIVATLPKARAGVVTTNVFYPFQFPNVGALGNNMLMPADHDKGVKFLYDKIIRFGPQQVNSVPGVAFKELTKVVKLWIKRKRASQIVFDTVLQEIVNKPLAIYAIPYEQYSTIETDNVVSMAGFMRMYYKDI